jgi:hypothetical protein
MDRRKPPPQATRALLELFALTRHDRGGGLYVVRLLPQNFTIF